MKIADGELRQILLHDLKLSAETVRELVADSRQRRLPLLKTVLASKQASDNQIGKAHAKRIGVPFVELEVAGVHDATVQKLPRAIAARYRVICIDETPTSIKVAMADPRNEQARKALRDYCGKTVRRYLATERGLTFAMKSYNKQDDSPLPLSTRELLATILEQASRNGSRDIHFEQQGNNLVIKRRVGKQLKVLTTLPLARYRALIGWVKLKTGNDVGNTEGIHHGRFSLSIHNHRNDVVVTIMPTIDGEKMVLRLVPPSESIPRLQAIGYGPKDAAHLQQLIQDGRGLILIAGGTSAEVPTTLASLAVEAVSRPNTTVSTIEEPLHYQITGATQTEVTDALTFADIVSATTAQSPSTIVTANLGGGASAEALIDFSLSQHLVISGLYATSLHSAMSKLAAYPIAPALIAASLRIIVVQHQLPALCSHCRTSFAPSGPLKKALWSQFGFTNESRLYRKGPGCSRCEHGVNGTTLATEWLAISVELQQLIATKADSQSINEHISSRGDYAIRLGELAAKGLISIDEATKRAVEFR